MDAIRDKRRELGMTQEQLAQKLGVTQGAVNKWETSECCPKSSRLKEVAEALGCTVDELLRYDDEAEKGE